MKRNLFVFLMVYIFSFTVSSEEIILFSERELAENYDWFKPHINIGTLVEVDYEDTIKNILKKEPLSEKNKYGYAIASYDDSMPRRAYKQYDEKSGVTFYRLMFQESYNSAYSFQMIYFVEEGNPAKLIFAEYYHTNIGLSDIADTCNNMMPIIRQNKLVGIMKYSYEEYYDYDSERVINHNSALVYWIDDKKTMDYNSFGNDEIDIRISATKPLLDKNDIFKYTIQNAFDGNPATSCVEGMKYSELKIYFTFSTKKNFLRLALINGYAANENLYYENNSVNYLSCDIGRFLERTSDDKWSQTFDARLNYQIKNFVCSTDFLSFDTRTLKGTKYNDTCVAEFNLKVEDTGLLFGGYL